SPNSRFLAAVNLSTATVEVFDVATGKERHSLPLPSAQAAAGVGFVVGPVGARRAFFSPDSRLVAATDTGIVIWDVMTGREVRQIGLPQGAVVRDAVFSHDGRTVAVDTGAGEVGVWEVASGQKRCTINPPPKADP